MREKRRQPRLRSPHRINVLAAADDRILGRLVDVTVGGLMFLASEDHAPGTVLHLRLPLPTMSGAKSAIEVECEVLWCRPDANPTYHRIGVEFLRLGAEEAYIIETVLQRLHLIG